MERVFREQLEPEIALRCASVGAGAKVSKYMKCNTHKHMLVQMQETHALPHVAAKKQMLCDMLRPRNRRRK